MATFSVNVVNNRNIRLSSYKPDTAYALDLLMPELHRKPAAVVSMAFSVLV